MDSAHESRGPRRGKGPAFGVDIEACRRNLLDRQRRRAAEREARRLRALEDVRRAVAGCAPRYRSVERVYLFGSVVRRGAFRTVSDVDVAVAGVEAGEAFAFWRDLEEATPEWTIDVREIKEESVFARRVRSGGVLVYERGDTDPQS